MSELRAGVYVDSLSKAFSVLMATSDGSVSDQIDFLRMKLKEADNLLPESASIPTKSAEASINYRNRANRAYNRLGHDREALKYYTKSIAVAPVDSEELAYGLARRSGVLWRLGKYIECDMDINRALKGKYPEALKSKLRERKSMCSVKIAEENRLKSFIMETAESLPSQGSFKNLLRAALKEYKLEECATEPQDVRPSIPAVNFNNILLPNASPKVQLDCIENWGRCLMASDYIEPGAILAIEKAFASTVSSDAEFNNCSHCFAKNSALIPCNGCSLAMYCSDHCRRESYDSYHKVECEIAPILSSLGSHWDEEDALALRTLLIGTKQGTALDSLMKNPDFDDVFALKGQKIDEKYIADYLSVCSLASYSNNFFKHDSLWYNQKIASILIALRKSSFFDATKKAVEAQKNLSKSMADVELFVGALILNHYCAIASSSVPVLEYLIPQSPNTKTLSSKIGSALCSFFGFINHSCDPNAIAVWNKDTMILYALRPIAAGEQICISYGPRYSDKRTPDRQAYLEKQYGFHCLCEPCKSDWPLCNKDKPEFLLQDFDSVEHLKDMIDVYDSYQYSDFPRDRLEFLREFSEVLHKTVKRPWEMFDLCESDITNLLNTSGNYYVVSVSDFSNFL